MTPKPSIYIYVPARLEDNPSMMADDPGYEMRLAGLGSRALVQAMRWAYA
jgi:hypothetical protein